jgi:hypothetical protein
MSNATTIDYAALAQQAGAISSVAPSVTPSATPGSGIDYSALAKQAGAISSAPAPAPAPSSPGGADTLSNWSPDQPLTSYGAATRGAIGGLGSDILNTVKAAASAMNPLPQSDEEKQAFQVAGVGGLLVHRMLSSLSPVGKAVLHPSEIIGAIHDINQSKDPISVYARIMQKTASQGAGAALTALATEGVTKGVGAVAGKAMGTAEEPGIVPKLVKGKKVEQAPTQSAVRGAVQASTEATGTADESLAANIENQPLVEGHNTVVDEHLSKLAENEKAAYKKLDDAAQFDLKAEKDQLATDRYKLKQLGNTDADVTQRGNLLESINDSQDRITAAETKLKKAGIDPRAGDVIHGQRMAGQQFRKNLVANTNPADGSINVQGLMKATQKSRFDPKFGDRLEQYLGSKQKAESFVNQLAAAKRTGASAVTAQTVAKWTGGILGTPAAIGAGYEVAKKLLE